MSLLNKVRVLTGFGDFPRRAVRRRLRRIMRGHARLRRDGRERLIVELMAALTHRRVSPGATSQWISGAAHSQWDLVARQYLLLRVRGATALNNSVLAALGRGGAVVHPLPREWRDELGTLDVPVARARAALLWWMYVGALWGHGVSVMAQTMLGSCRAVFRPTRTTGKGCAHFVGISRGNLPQPGSDGISHDILSWYWTLPGRPTEVVMLTHTAGQVDSGTTTPPFKGVHGNLAPLRPGALVRYTLWSAAAALYALVDMARGRWGHALLLGELAKATQVRLLGPESLASEYLFHASDVVYRPCWTYEIEARGSLATMYCYSTNSEPMTLADGTAAPLHSWQVMTWDRVMVWDQPQADFVSSATGGRVVPKVVGPIWFHTSATPMPALGDGAVAVFDVQPHRNCLRPPLPMFPDYYSFETAKGFLEDVVAVASECGRAVVFKRKRHAGPRVHRGYMRLVDGLVEARGFTSIDPDISAVRVVEACDAVISMPFTSTALLARHQGRPSVYYDPSGLIHPGDRAAHGIPVIQGRQALRSWFLTLPAGAAPAPRV